MPLLPDQIPIGVLAARSGVSTSALRFYEARGLLRRVPGTGEIPEIFQRITGALDV